MPKEKVASTRHFVADESYAEMVAIYHGIDPTVAEIAFVGEPRKMVDAIAEWAVRKDIEQGDNRNESIMLWAIRVGRGRFNPDPMRYHRNADKVIA